MRRAVAALMVVVLSSLAGRATASEKAEAAPADEAPAEAAAEAPSEAVYVELKPAFVTNYGTADDGRMRFVRADVSLRVSGPEASTAVQYHMPQVRANLLAVLARQEEQTLVTPDGRTQLREAVLGGLRAIFEKEERQPMVEEVLFTNLLVHR